MMTTHTLNKNSQSLSQKSMQIFIDNDFLKNVIQIYFSSIFKPNRMYLHSNILCHFNKPKLQFYVLGPKNYKSSLTLILSLKP